MLRESFHKCGFALKLIQRRKLKQLKRVIILNAFPSLRRINSELFSIKYAWE